MWLAAIGIGAGLTTTLAGLGGGVMMLVVLAAWWGDPVRALAVTTPALLVGNVHRAFLFRRALDLRASGPFVAASFAGCLAGALAVLSVPPWVVQVSLVATTALALARQLGVLRVEVPGRWLGLAGIGVGLSAAPGGAGLLGAPVLQSAGFSGDRYVANLALAAALMHVARLMAFGAGGALDRSVWLDAAAIAVGIPIGNTLGSVLRARLGEGTTGRLELGAMVALVALSLAGFRAG